MHEYQGYQLNDIEYRIATTIDALCEQCFIASSGKGFWSDYDEIRTIIGAGGAQGPATSKLLKALEGMMVGQKIALIGSELGEALEANRKHLSSDHLPELSGEEEELADVAIRSFDFSGKRKLRLGIAIVLKLRFNAGREHMHGKAY